MIDGRKMLAWEMKALLKVRRCVVCVLHEGPDVSVPGEPVGRSQCELGGMKINRSRARHMEEV